MSHHAALKQAHDIYLRRESMNRYEKADAAIALGEWDLFSNRQIGVLTGLRYPSVAEYTRKSNRTGGRLNPDAIPLILDVIERHSSGRPVNVATSDALRAGVSSNMLSRLTGIAQSNISRWALQADINDLADAA